MSTTGNKKWPDEGELLARIATRDEVAFSVVFDKYHKRLYSYTP